MGIYHFSGMDRYGCQLFDSIKVRSLPLPVFSLGKDTTIYSIQSINIQANQTLSAYQWQDGSFSSSYLFNGSNDNIGQNLVWLKGTDKNGCSNTDSLLVTVKQVVFSNAQQLDSANISIFPNPAHGLVNYSIDISLQNILVRVVDNFGHVYLEKQVGDYIQNIPDQMNVSMLNEGMYYIKVYSSSAVKSQVFYVR
jgi:hypothetical protein